jgi:ketosteroid isomerase-like protein
LPVRPSPELTIGFPIGTERSLQSFHGTGYELLDSEVQLHGDLGIVYFTAKYDYRDGDGKQRSLPLRSMDIYRKEDGEWIQTGSHITPIPSGGTWGEGPER